MIPLRDNIPARSTPFVTYLVVAANAIVFLASSMASYVTGTSINMDGGLAGTV